MAKEADPASLQRIRELLRLGFGPDKVVREITGRAHDPLHTIVVVEKTKLDGTWESVPPTPEAVRGGSRPRTADAAVEGVGGNGSR